MNRSKTIAITVLSVLTTTVIYASTDIMQRYDIKSAKIEYKITKSGDVMGMVQTKTIGKKRLIFENYGTKELTELSEVTKTTTNGKSKVHKVHTLKYMNGGILYSVDFKRKKIIRMKNPALGMGALFGGDKSMKQSGEDMMKKMGGKKIGVDKVLGYKCDVWDLMGVQQCIYKGVVLRVMSNMMGLKSTEIATKVSFDSSLDKDDFKLPDFPLTDKYGKALNLDRGNLDALDAKQSAKATREASDAGKAMAAGLKALAATGVNLSSDKKITPEQEAAMQKAMMEAMGGEKRMVEKQKREIIGSFRRVMKAKPCFRRAKTSADANACERMIDSEEPDFHSSWNKREKAELLKEIDAFEKAMPCIAAAKDFATLQQCMSH